MEYNNTDDEAAAEVRTGGQVDSPRPEPEAATSRDASDTQPLLEQWGEIVVKVLIVGVPVVLIGGYAGELAGLTVITLSSAKIAIGAMITLAGLVGAVVVLWDELFPSD